jgi:hypothetical protein
MVMVFAKTTKKESTMFKYAVLILLAFQVLYCESAESGMVPRTILARADSSSRRNIVISKVRETSVMAAAEPVRVKSTVEESEGLGISLNAFDLCLCGAFATAFGDFVMHPVDTIKVSQQASAVAVGMFQTIKNLWVANGVSAFYPGKRLVEKSLHCHI